MNLLLMTIELHPEMKRWIDWFAYDNGLSFNEALQQILEFGIEIIKNNAMPLEFPKAQKLLLQCVMENLLMLEEVFALAPTQREHITEKARLILRKTLALPEPQCPSS